jgi:predicted RNA-binding protein
MCLSNVYKNEVSDANLLARNVADIRIENGMVYFTDIMGIRTAFNGSLEQIDLTENYIIVREA